MPAKVKNPCPKEKELSSLSSRSLAPFAGAAQSSAGDCAGTEKLVVLVLIDFGASKICCRKA